MSHKYVNYAITFLEFPSESALCINLSNCPNKCDGCHSSYLRGDIGTPLTTDELFRIIDENIDEITCVGFMGGDSDTEELIRLAISVSEKYNELRIGWYSGRTNLPKGYEVFDYIKLGRYDKSCGGLNHPNTNQRFYVNNGTELIDITKDAFQRNDGNIFDSEKYLRKRV